jgi:23S rRNA pseudouridine1911/1915/1917 synthase
VQLSSIKCPIAGDVKYGSSTSNFDKSICLHSYSLQFLHPTLKEKMELKTKPELQGLWKLFTDYINTEL